MSVWDLVPQRNIKVVKMNFSFAWWLSVLTMALANVWVGSRNAP
jgi:hypothetical protein